MAHELVGLTAVGLVTVEGRGGTPEAFSTQDRRTAREAVIRAEQTLARLSQQLSPNRFLQCNFFNDLRVAVIDPPFISPPTNTLSDPAMRSSEIQTREPQWRDLALETLGFINTPGVADPLDRYVDFLLHKDWLVPQKPRRAVVLFVTKFPTGWIAYANLNGSRATFQFDWIASDDEPFGMTGAQGPGIENLDRVVAHEMGHLFGGLDEAGPCDSTETSGPRPTTNANCHGFDPCLMAVNSNTVCLATTEHFGWVDLDGDGMVDAQIPIVTSLSDTGIAGERIDILGSGLGEARSVVFTGVGAAEFSIVSDTQLTARVPVGSGSDIDVFVTTSTGITRPSPILRFTYIG
jgi:hypothetical protein